MGVRLRTPFLLPASHDRARFVHSFLPPRFPRTRSRANARPAWRSARSPPGNAAVAPSRAGSPNARGGGKRRATRKERTRIQAKTRRARTRRVYPYPPVPARTTPRRRLRRRALPPPPRLPSRRARVRRRSASRSGATKCTPPTKSRWTCPRRGGASRRVPARGTPSRSCRSRARRRVSRRTRRCSARRWRGTPSPPPLSRRRGATLGAPSPRTSSATRASWTRSRASSRPGRSSRLPSRAGRVSRRVSNERPYSSSRRCLFPTRAHAVSTRDAKRRTSSRIRSRRGAPRWRPP